MDHQLLLSRIDSVLGCTKCCALTCITFATSSRTLLPNCTSALYIVSRSQVECFLSLNLRRSSNTRFPTRLLCHFPGKIRFWNLVERVFRILRVQAWKVVDGFKSCSAALWWNDVEKVQLKNQATQWFLHMYAPPDFKKKHWPTTGLNFPDVLWCPTYASTLGNRKSFCLVGSSWGYDQAVDIYFLSGLSTQSNQTPPSGPKFPTFFLLSASFPGSFK